MYICVCVCARTCMRGCVYVYYKYFIKTNPFFCTLKVKFVMVFVIAKSACFKYVCEPK